LDYLIIGGLSVSVESQFDYHRFALDPDTTYLTSPNIKDENNEPASLCTKIVPDTQNAMNYVLVRARMDIKYRSTQVGVDDTTCSDVSLYFGNNRLICYDADHNGIEDSIYYDKDTDSDGVNDSIAYNPDEHLNKWYKIGEYYYFLGVIGRDSSFVVEDSNKNVPLIFNDGYKTNNSFTNTLSGSNINMFLSVEVIQGSKNAVLEDWIDDPLDANDNGNSTITIPSLFINFIEALEKGTHMPS
jgi:hypothetical protein